MKLPASLTNTNNTVLNYPSGSKLWKPEYLEKKHLRAFLCQPILPVQVALAQLTPFTLAAKLTSEWVILLCTDMVPASPSLVTILALFVRLKKLPINLSHFHRIQGQNGRRKNVRLIRCRGAKVFSPPARNCFKMDISAKLISPVTSGREIQPVVMDRRSLITFVWKQSPIYQSCFVLD